MPENPIWLVPVGYLQRVPSEPACCHCAHPQRGKVCCPWMAGITDSRPRNEGLYLAVVLDTFARKVAGWERASDVQAAVCMAMQLAVMPRRRIAGWTLDADCRETSKIGMVEAYSPRVAARDAEEPLITS